MITVLLADDQDLVRAGLRALLSGAEDIEVVAEAPDGAAAVTAALTHVPAVVLMDLRMPVMDGTAATRRIRAETALSGTRVLVLTTFDDDEDVLAAVRAGAAGYLLKDTRAEALREAVRTVAAGGNLLSPQVARTLMEHMAEAGPLPSRTTATGGQDREETEAAAAGRIGPTAEAVPVDLSALTEREMEVLARLAHGETNAEIGAHLFLSPATARTYVSRMLTKLGARDRTELALLAQRAGLGG
ncbi:response regulator transcription factor [Brevibacterium album]|uniref:response regulator transcription factor n=1 Tax=Brevibacterium album TaxID=417948 RepID=UPI000404C5C9|nr:response regulator transcription factor [Brevibacterium album]